MEVIIVLQLYLIQNVWKLWSQKLTLGCGLEDKLNKVLADKIIILWPV